MGFKQWWKNRPYWQKGGIILLILTLIFLLIFSWEKTLMACLALLLFLGAILTISIILLPIYLLTVYIKKNKKKVKKITKIWIVFMIIYLIIGVIFYTENIITRDNIKPIRDLMVMPFWGIFCIWVTLAFIICNIKNNCTQLGL